MVSRRTANQGQARADDDEFWSAAIVVNDTDEGTFGRGSGGTGAWCFIGH